MSKIKRRAWLKSIGAFSVAAGLPGAAPCRNIGQTLPGQGKFFGNRHLGRWGRNCGNHCRHSSRTNRCPYDLDRKWKPIGGMHHHRGSVFSWYFPCLGRTNHQCGIGWELVLDAVELNGDQLPDFSKIPKSHWKHQVAVNPALYVMLAEEKCLEAGVDIRYYETPTSVKFENARWLVESTGKGVKTIISAKQLIDCTGNALIASMAGYKVLREKETQPGSLVYSMGGYDFDQLDLSKIPKRYHRALHQNMLTSQIRKTGENNFCSLWLCLCLRRRLYNIGDPHHGQPKRASESAAVDP